MKIGIFLASQFPEGVALDTAIDNLAAQVRACRDNGFHSVWTGQHFLTAPMQMIQTGPLLARLAAEGEGMTFGPSVVLLPMLNPVVVAEEAASLDWITGGHSVLGVGIGYRREEFEALGVPFADRAGRMEEAIPLIRRLWNEDVVDHDGTHFKVGGLGASIRPKRAGGPPIWVGGKAAAAVRRAARLGDAWMISPMETYPEIADRRVIYDAVRAESGLPPPTDMAVVRECCIGATREAALAVGGGPLLAKYQSYASWGTDGAGDEGDLAATFDDFMTDRFLVGDEAEVADEMARYGDGLGVNHMIARLQWPGLSQAAVLDAIERFGRAAAHLA
jgi:alkanesulfonate monooxygenase SsuD/methylene tetrahydromethanopterin reductase-like flavin-dependent oxidoreductase (luciferase family)